ncbi:two-component regulator propeller domain-containing protein [Dysgonomonas sp. 520]|uniref:type IX secretion system anionic LPS delivery protein PorZ n=1 Tax=Dysgonomonas sp. 520 TaxID=2302931 RepID=UPI0013D4F0D7|nr:two-component regulator propeller domain-containing protein [Dysgonomonas sp. 520]NDW10502.1 hypothetical protein [Dysgonomonas sp. 520]
MGKKSAFFIILLFFATNTLFSQKIGDWSTYFSYEAGPEAICDAGDVIYVLTDGKLFSYNPQDKNMETHVKLEGGNNNILKIAYSDKSGTLLILRDDYDIDILDKNNNYTNIPSLKNTTQNIDKTVNNISVYEDMAYLSSNFGLVIIDMAKAEVKETCPFPFKVYSACVLGDYIYISSERGVRIVDQNKNILDQNNWTQIVVAGKYAYSDYTFYDNEIMNMAIYKDKIHMLVPGRAVYILYDEYVERVLEGKGITQISSTGNDRFIAHASSSFYNFSGLEQYQQINLNSENSDTIYSLCPKKNKDNQYWLGISNKNLCLVNVADNNSNSLEFVESEIKPNGPLSNLSFFLAHDGEKLMSTGGGYYLDRHRYPAQLSQYKDNIWFNYDKTEIDNGIDKSDWTAINEPSDFVSVVSDPYDRSHLFVASWGEGVYEFRDKKFVELHSDFETLDSNGSPNYRRVNGMSYDRNGNLWISNSKTSDFITIRTKDGQWLKPNYNNTNIISGGMVDYTGAKSLIVDRYNRKWIATFRKTPFIMVIDDNNTINNVLDDKVIYQTSFYDQDYNALKVDLIYDIKEDKSGNIWVATDLGPFVIYNSSNIFTKKELTLNKIKIPRNDGTNFADILLENSRVRTLAVDGANRKWIGTEDAGLFLVSEDGKETIHTFTTKNSALPSNRIESLAIDPVSGEVYVGTSNGLVSFKSDATEGRSDFSNVYVYPNPVRPEYDGPITVYGLQADSNVKITDVKGNIINQGKSLGGQYIWNGRNGKGANVDTGTYLVLGSSSDGSSGVVTKILVVR